MLPAGTRSYLAAAGKFVLTRPADVLIVLCSRRRKRARRDLSSIFPGETTNRVFFCSRIYRYLSFIFCVHEWLGSRFFFLFMFFSPGQRYKHNVRPT